MNTELTVPLYYEIYLQDLTNSYIDLILLGRVNTHDEAINCCKIFKEAINNTKDKFFEGRNLRNCTVLFKPIIKTDNK